MPGPYGVVAEGFRRKLQQEILDEMTADQRAGISPKVNTFPNAPLGQVNASVSREIALGWEVLEAAYDSLDRDRAEGEALDALGKLTGTPRPVATYSEVTLECDLAATTELVSGAHFSEVDGEPDNRWTPKANFIAPTSAVHEVVFRSENKGAKSANAGTITVISTPVTGWNGVTNPDDASPGREIAKDPEYRQVQEADVNRAGSTAASAIETDLRAITIDGARPVVSATCIENDTDIDGINGLPAHTIECVIHDTPAVSNDVIAQVILDSKAAGIGTQGSTSGLAVKPDGTTKVIYFSRAIVRDVYLEYNLTVGTGYVGDPKFKTDVVADLRGRHKVGTDVFRWHCELAGRQEGVENLSVNLGFAPSPVGTADLSISEREIASFDTARITII